MALRVRNGNSGYPETGAMNVNVPVFGLVMDLCFGRFPPGVRLNGHCRLDQDSLFTRSKALALSRKRRSEMERAMMMASGMGMSRQRAMQMVYESSRTVPLETDLFEMVVIEDSPVGVPTKVREFYGSIFEKHGILSQPMDVREQAYRVLRDIPDCCVPAALLGETLRRGKITLCRLGFRNPHNSRGPVEDWEYGEYGVQWV